MQVGTVNSVNFKSSSLNFDFDDARKDIRAVREIQGALSKSNDNDSKKSKKKNFLEITASIGATFLAAFLLSKKFYKKGSVTFNQVKDKFDNSKLKSQLQEKINNSESIKKITDSAKEQIAKIKLPDGLKRAVSKVKEITPDFVKNFNVKLAETIKKNPENTVGVLAATAGTVYVSTTDSDGNGIADIAEKGVNAVKGAVDKIQIVKDALEVLT